MHNIFFGETHCGCGCSIISSSQSLEFLPFFGMASMAHGKATPYKATLTTTTHIIATPAMATNEISIPAMATDAIATPAMSTVYSCFLEKDRPNLFAGFQYFSYDIGSSLGRAIRLRPNLSFSSTQGSKIFI